jgi:hypothetical protein
LRNGQFFSCDFSAANLRRCNVSGSRASSTAFKGADLSGADFTGTVLANCSFHDTSLYGARLRDVDLDDVDFTGADFDEKTDFHGTPWWLGTGWTMPQILALAPRFRPKDVAESATFLSTIDALQRDIDKAAQAKNDDQQAELKNQRAYYRAVRGVQLAAALADVNAALKKKRAPHFFATRGLIDLELARFSEAIKDLELAQFGPVPGQVSYHLALAHHAFNRAENERTLRKQAAKLGYQPTYERVLLSFKAGIAQTPQATTTDPLAQPQPSPQTPVVVPNIAGLEPYEVRIIGLTAMFENTNWETIRGDFDGGGITFGIGEWDMRHDDSLPQLLRDMRSEDQTRFDAIIGDGLPDIQTLLASDTIISQRLALAKTVFQGAPGKLSPQWQKRFQALGQDGRFIAVQARRLKRILLPKASELARRFSLHSERGIALMYDVLVQNGMRQTLDQAITARLSDPSLTSETDRMVAIANTVADATKAPVRDDVRARKMTIATGRGEVHGVAYDLDAIGITLNPPSASVSP